MKSFLYTTAPYTRLLVLLSLPCLFAGLFSLHHAQSKPMWEPPPLKSGNRDLAARGYSGTRRMAERLKIMAASREPQYENFALGAQRIAILQGRLVQAGAPNIRLSLMGQLAQELLNAGRVEAALKAYEDYVRFAQARYLSPEFRFRRDENAGRAGFSPALPASLCPPISVLAGRSQAALHQTACISHRKRKFFSQFFLSLRRLMQEVYCRSAGRSGELWCRPEGGRSGSSAIPCD